MNQEHLYKQGQENYALILDRNEAARFLGITLPTLHKYTKNGILKGYRLGTMVRYKRSELLSSLEAMQSNKKG